MSAQAPVDIVPSTIRAWAAALANELESSRHQVALVPAPRPAFTGHRIRRAVDVLPEWYRQLMSAHASRRQRLRHFQTAIKRQWTLRGLRAIAAGRRGRYADRLLPVIQQQIDIDEAQARHLQEIYG